VLGYFHIVRSADDTHLRLFGQSRCSGRIWVENNLGGGDKQAQRVYVCARDPKKERAGDFEAPARSDAGVPGADRETIQDQGPGTR